MEIEIRKSGIMDRLYGKEIRVICMPEMCRQRYGYSVGDFIDITEPTTGKTVMLEVRQAFSEDVNNGPHFAYLTEGIFSRVVNDNTAKIKRVENITLGCDPETFLVQRDTELLIEAYRFMSKSGDVGNDGILMEFRPRPSVDAEVVCGNIWGLLNKARGILNRKPLGRNVRIQPTSHHRPSGLTAGFHLHYGLPNGFLGTSKEVNDIARMMVRVFDYYVGVPSIIPEGNEDSGRRTDRRMPYGKPGGFRLDWRTLEFRLPGAVNLAHPVLTAGLLALGAAVAEDVASRINTCTDCFNDMGEITRGFNITELYPNLPPPEEVQATICNPDIGPARWHFNNVIRNDVVRMLGYKTRQSTVEAYFSSMEGDNPKFSNDMEYNWRQMYEEHLG